MYSLYWLYKIILFFFCVTLNVAKCIDYYTSLRVKRYEGRQEEEPIDPKLESIVNRMFKRCFEDREYKQAIGIALETRRNDILQKAILDSVRKIINRFRMYQ